MGAVSEFASAMDWDGLTSMLLRIVAILICIIIHEMSHGLAAYWLGDPTAKQNHRLSMNPLHHLDPFGLLMMVVVGFGWAKPVPVDARYFKNPKSGMALTAFAGPLSNFILAYLTAIALHVTVAAANHYGYGVGLQKTAEFLSMLLILNIGLGLFNLIPFPPLDGSKMIGVFLPDRLYYQVLRYEHFGIFLLMVVLWTGWLDIPLYAARTWLFDQMIEASAFAQTLAMSLFQ